MKDVSHLETFYPDKSKIKDFALGSGKKLFHHCRLERAELDNERQ